MEKILIKNGNVILFEKIDMSDPRYSFKGNNLQTVVKKLDILIEGTKIIKLDKNIIDENATLIDATNKAVMPGLINMHVHVPMSIFRELVDGFTLDDWLKKEIWPREDKLTPNDIYYTSMLSLIEACRTGTTLLNDHYFFTESIIKATHDIPLRYVASRCLMGENTKDNRRIDELLEIYNKREEDSDTNIYNILALHGLYTTNDDYLKLVSKLCHEYNFSLHTHFCENSKEVEDIKKIYNVKNPYEVLEKYFDDINLILAHCVKLNDNDFNFLKNVKANIVHNPISNLKLGCGFADIKKALKNNINVCLGTDGQGSGSNLDMFEAMNIAALIQKGYKEDPTILDASTAIQMATINGAKALNMDDKIGSIEVGKLADIIIVDLSDITLNPVNNLLSDIVYNAKGRDVTHTIVNGKILMKDKKLTLNIDENNIICKCNEILKKISEK